MNSTITPRDNFRSTLEASPEIVARSPEPKALGEPCVVVAADEHVVAGNAEEEEAGTRAGGEDPRGDAADAA